MARKENTKATVDNSSSNPIGACDREINRLEEIERTLDNEFLHQPNKEFLASDLWEFLEDFPQVKANIKSYIRNNLECLSICLYYREVIQRYRKMVIELRQQLKEKGGKE